MLLNSNESGIAAVSRSRMPERRIPGPGIIASVRAYFLMRENKIAFIQYMNDTFGQLSKLSIASRSLLIVSSQSAAREILANRQRAYIKGPGVGDAVEYFGSGLLTAEGAEWMRRRRIFSAMLNTVSPDAIVETVYRCIEEAAKNWSTIDNIGCIVNITELVTSVAYSVMSKHIMGVAFDHVSLQRDLCEVERCAMRRSVALVPNFLGKTRSLSLALQSLRQRSLCVLNASGPASQDSEASLFARIRRDDGFEDGAILDDISTFMLASHDNVATAVIWTLALLSRRPDIQELIRDEAGRTNNGHRPGAAEFENLTWTRAAMLESMRLFPPVWAITRRTTEDTTVLGYSLQANTDVIISPYLIHRDETTWEHARQYRPERFKIKDIQTNGGDLFLPFGLGPRRCVAAEFATVEAMAILVSILTRYRLSCPNDWKLDAVAGFALRPRGDQYCSFSPV